MDARMLLGRFSGIARVVTRLADVFAQRTDVQLVALCGDEVPAQWRDHERIEVLTSSFTRRHRNPVRRRLWEELHLPGLIRRARAEVFHATWNSGVPVRCPVPAVVTIHDLIPWHRPQEHFATWFQQACYRCAILGAAGRAAVVTTVSDSVRQDVLKTLRIDAGKIVTVPNGVRLPTGMDIEQPANPQASGLKPPASSLNYVLYVGGHEQRKNVAAVFESLRVYWELFDPNLQLRLTGEERDLAPSAREAFHQLPHKHCVVFLGSPDDTALSKCYASARCLLLLSEAEGFGLPALEAMAHGCPVIVSTDPALGEVVGDAGIRVDPRDFRSVADRIHAVMTDPVLRATLIDRGRRRAAFFRWEAAADRLVEIYDRLAGRLLL
jgi:glycosyltransferase involved in cell wall biosynthesis